MQNNGFGTFQTRIIVSVPKCDADEAERRLKCRPLDSATVEPRVLFEVNTSARRSGDDESIVIEMWSLLEDPENPIDWQIEWDTSEY